MFASCAIPPVNQVSTNTEIVVPNTTMDLSQTEHGAANYIISETGGVNGVWVYFQFSNDAVNWIPGPNSGYLFKLGAGARAVASNNTTGNSFPIRFIRLSLIDAVAGNHGTLQVQGGFGK